MSRARSIKWANKASADLSSIMEYIAERNESAAFELQNHILDVIDNLATRPIGRPGAKPGTFERVLSRYRSYIIIYAYDDSMLRVLRIFHTAQSSKE